MNAERQVIGQLSFDQPQADLKDAQVPAIHSVHQLAQALPNTPTAEGDEPKVEQSHRQGEARQAQKMTQHRAFQVKAMLFEIAEHLFNGLITNDKFCLTRTGKLRLSHWRRPLRLRAPETRQTVYSASEESDCGGNHETQVEDPSPGTGVCEWAEPLGSSLSTDLRDSSRFGGEPMVNEPGGVSCE
jgi:hypothetical protein